jgi:hypothetical protein
MLSNKPSTTPRSYRCKKEERGRERGKEGKGSYNVEKI